MLRYHHFDTYKYSANSTSMANYINGLPYSTVLVGVTADDAQNQLKDNAKGALLRIGVDVSELQYRGKVSFVAQVGRPSAALQMLATQSADVVVLEAAVRC